MEYIILFILIVIIVLLNSIKKVKPSKAYVIERFGKFYKIAEKGRIFVIPFVDRLKYTVDLNNQKRESCTNIAILSDGNSIRFKTTMYFHVINASEVVYGIKNLERELEYKTIKLVREMISKNDSDKIKELKRNIQRKLKTSLDFEFQKLGVKIDNIELEFIEGTYEIPEFKGYNPNREVVTENYNNTKFYVILISIVILYFVIIFRANDAYRNTNNLFFYLVYLIGKYILYILPCIAISSSIILKINTKERIDIKKTISKKYKMLVEAIIGGILLLCTFECLYMPNSYRFVKIDGKNTKILNYKYLILKDAIKNQTTIKTTSNIIAEKSERRARRYSYTPAYITIDSKYSSEVTNKIVVIIDALKELEDEITIEYYNNSGIIKSIDGINKFDYDKLEERITYLAEQKEIELKEKAKEEEKNKKEEEEKQEKERELKTIEYRIKQNSIGKNIEIVKKELQENGILESSIKYISSKKYSVGTVAFVDRVDRKID